MAKHNEQNECGRRELLIAAGGAAASLAAAGTAWAKSPPVHDHHGAVNADLIDALAACETRGEACLSHCLDALATGDTSLGACAVHVREMLAVCSAMSTLAASGSDHAKALASVCAAACKDCAAACREHASMHPTCRDCMEACERTVEQLRAYTA